MKKETREGILIFLITSIIMLLASEFLIRIFYGNHLQYKVDKDVYWELKPNQFGYQTPGFPFAHINSDGFRGEELSKSSNRYRVMMLGCSNAFGQAVSDNETFPFQLQQMLGSDYEVINAGTPGWGVFQSVERFKKIEPLYKPKTVVLTLISHSPYRQPFNSEEDRNSYLKKMKIRSFLMRSAFLSFFSNSIQKFLGSNLGASANVKNNTDQFEYFWQQDKKRLLELKRITDEKKIKLILVGYTMLGSEDERFLKLLKEFQKETGIQTISNLNEIFSAYSKDDLHPKNESHPSSLANKVVAEQILKRIK